MTDVQVAEQIGKDEIHILIDLARHTGSHRLPVFGLRPAPVQIAYLGYPNTTGLEASDYRITDQWADPVGESDKFCTETLVRLRGGFLCYGPNVNSPEVSPPPVQRRGFVTFGSFNAIPKLSPEVISLWSEILRRTPGSFLSLKSFPLNDPPTREIILNRFSEEGIPRDRILCYGFIPEGAEHLRMYGEVDIALDTFPYNGTTTTVEAMWMGVSVVTLIGDRHAGRVGYSLLKQVGLEELCADSHVSYAEITTELASDEKRLRKIRNDLRERMKNPPLCDEKRLAREMEQHYERCLHSCQGQKGASGQSGRRKGH